MNNISDTMTQIHLNISKLNEDYIILWKEEMFLTWRWWVQVALLFVPWFVWYFIKKKESTNRLLLSGLFVYLMTSILDSIGVAFGLWHYLYTPLPYLHTFFLPWDFSAFPVMIMLLIQIKPNINPYIKALFFACISAFVFEPFFTWLKLYVPLNWEHYYGIPLHFIIYVIADRVSRRKHFKPIK
jgi:hypothetical protein